MNREKLYKEINEKGLRHKDTVKASQELDKVVLVEMINGDSVVENIYLKQVIKAKEAIIDNLTQRIIELSEIAAMRVESGESAITAIGIVTAKAYREGLLNEVGIHGIKR